MNHELNEKRFVEYMALKRAEEAPKIGKLATNAVISPFTFGVIEIAQPSDGSYESKAISEQPSSEHIVSYMGSAACKKTISLLKRPLDNATAAIDHQERALYSLAA